MFICSFPPPDDTSHTSITVSPLGIRKGKYYTSHMLWTISRRHTHTHPIIFFIKGARCFLFFFKYTLRFGEKFNFRKTKNLLHSPSSLHVTIDTICCSLFCSHCYRSADIVSTAHYPPRPPPTPLYKLTACCLFFLSSDLLLQSQENNKHRNNFTIVSFAADNAPLNWSYSWTNPILEKKGVFLSDPPIFFFFFLYSRCTSSATIFATGTSVV